MLLFERWEEKLKEKMVLDMNGERKRRKKRGGEEKDKEGVEDERKRNKGN